MAVPVVRHLALRHIARPDRNTMTLYCGKRFGPTDLIVKSVAHEEWLIWIHLNPEYLAILIATIAPLGVKYI